MENNVQVFDGLKVKEVNGQLMFDAETAAIGMGIVSTAKGYTNVRWSRLNEYLNSAKTGRKISKGDFITESQLYKLAIKANNPVADKFQNWITEEVVPSIRKTGSYGQPKTPREVIKTLLLGNEEVNQRIDGLTGEVDNLKKNFGMPEELATQIKDKLNSTVRIHLGYPESSAYKDASIRGKAYSRAWGDLKQYFGVAKYRNIPAERFDEAMTYATQWLPDTNLRLQINEINNQTELEV
ncbi:Phage antirepressor protein [Weissella jogaejeotgali]|uniref:Phage antirepressor protein n=1 Tax=Weissella jogaejeotgali TaxID=1631871 RepID=A0A1L6R9T8_9LACO|nr:ORF6C domain-containing protein [Weissella jogaejeotgali]APS41283.1 Phage antirepressor protein [Weissella jogaejeotgali]